MATTATASPTTRIGRVFTTLANFDPFAILERKRDVPRSRTVFYNEPLPESYYDSKHRPAKGYIYASNQIITAKYNIVTFLPKNLLEQFRRVANIFFLIIVVLQFFPQFTNINPGLSTLPLIAVLFATAVKDGYEDIKRHKSDRTVNKRKVLTLGGGGWINTNWTHNKSRDVFGRIRLPDGPKTRRAKKEARELTNDSHSTQPVPPSTVPAASGRPKPKKSYSQRFRHDETQDTAEDIDQEVETHGEKHEHADWHLRYSHLSHLRPDEVKWRRRMWEDVRVGDFVKLRNNDWIPADIVILSTSGDENSCYVETKNLDGETNLKVRQAVSNAGHIRSARDCAASQFRIESEAPDVNMFSWNAALTYPAEGPSAQKDKYGDPLRVPVSLNTTLLRGCVLRNTDWVIGAVVMTGIDSKIAMNSGRTPSKRSRIERQMNPQVLLNLLILAAMVVMCAIVDHYLEVSYYANQAYWLFLDSQGDDNPNINGLVTFANGLIAFQNIIPISLYITIEFVKLCQAAFIYFDDAILYRKTGQRSLARTWNLSDDLGQIDYIFSDKTGTLTQNVMQFRRCAINGVVYGDDESADNATLSQDEKAEDQATRQGKLGPIAKSATESDEAEANETEGSSSGRTIVNEKDSKLPKYATAKSSLSTNSGESDSNTSSAQTSPGGSSTSAKKLTIKPNEVVQRFSDQRLSKDLQDTTSAHGRTLHAFWATLALCHFVVATEGEDGRIRYTAQSPDEAALVQAAADVGFVYSGRDLHILKIRTPFSSGFDEYELLNVLEFTSNRKRMSVVVRRRGGDADGRIYLLTKGADNVIFERLAGGQDDVKGNTQQNLEDFANEGLRTLCLAYREISEEEYGPWSRKYDEAYSSVENRDSMIEQACATIERDLLLLGATAIEDKLQDGVPDAIRDLKRAGIKMWVLTGDKLETAISIGFSSNLLSKDMTLILIRGGQYGEKNSAYNQLKNALERFFGEESLAPQNGLEDTARNDYELTRTQTGMSLVRKAYDGRDHGRYALIIDGGAMNHAFAESATEALFLSLATRCQAVIGCRSSPLQKALVVNMVKNGRDAMTLAIGDGANDVSMIQAAHVGVGVSGEEGLQAVNASDYAIAQFRFLQRLVLVHGHWSYMRTSNMIVNFFYKNIIGIAVIFYFQFYCAYSATTVYEFTYLLFWNSFWTLTAVMAAGLFERDVSDRALMEVPELYAVGRERRAYGMKVFLIYMIDGIYQGAICFFFILYLYKSTTGRSDGYDVGLYEFSTVMAIVAVTQANLFNGLNIRSWSWWVVFGVFLGIVLVWVYTAVYSALPPTSVWSQVYGNDHFLFHSALFWFSFPLVIFLCMAPRYLYKYWTNTYYPEDIEIIREITKLNNNHDFANDPNMPGLRTAAMYAENDLIAKGTKERSDNGAGYGREDNPEADGMKRPGALPLRRPYTHQSRGSQVDMSTGGGDYSYRGSFVGMEEGEGDRYLRRIRTERSTVEGSQPKAEEAEASPKSRRNTLMRSIRPRSGSSGLFPAMRKTLKRPSPKQEDFS